MAAAAPTTHASRPARSDLLLAVPACLFAVATIAVIESTTPWGTTYSGSSIGALAGDLAAGLGLLLAAALSIGEPTSRRVGWLLALAAIAWFAPDWVGWQRGDPVVRSIAALVQPLFAPLLAWAVALPLLDRSARAGLRRTLRLCVGGALLLSVALILVDDPRQDATCWNNCTDNAFLVASEPRLAASLGAVTSLAAILSGVLLAFVAVLRARLASTAGRRLLWPIAAPAVAVGAVVALRGVVLLPRPMQDPRGFPDMPLYLALGWATATLAGGFAWRALRAAHVERLVAAAVQRLPATGAPDSMAAAIGRAAGDPTLTMLYRLDGPSRWMDGAGSVVEEPMSDDRAAVVPLVVDGTIISAMIHDREIMEAGAIARRLGAAGRLAIENERLQVAVGERLDDLRESRARIVRRSDEERRTLERDLHDGAQQRLLALSYDLRMARTQLDREGDATARSVLDDMIGEVRAAHDELRVLAHGLFPAVLGEAGLEPALQTLVDRTPLLVDLQVGSARWEPELEMALYAVVSEGLDDAVLRAATQASVSIASSPRCVELVLSDDGSRLREPPPHLADRAGAAGGTVDLDEGGPANGLRVRLPCG